MGFLSGLIMGIYMLFTDPKALFGKGKQAKDDKPDDSPKETKP